MRPGTWPSTPSTLSLVDFDFAKEQLLLMMRSLYFHPSGQIPAYEWNFSDVNPPVHAWATLWLYKYRAVAGPGGPSLPGTVLSGPDAEFQLVGEPEGPLRAQCLCRGISGTGQHRHIRPERAASDGRVAGAGGRDGLDGVLLPVHAGDRPDSAANTTRCTRRWLSSSSSISCGFPTPWTASASIRTRCGMSRTGFSMICCGFPTARPCV